MSGENYRADGVRIQHDPTAPGMAEKYGAKGSTDPDGFDPYADSVGAGIYGGNVKRDTDGTIIIGAQYQNHNARPGPVYDGSGYSDMSKALQRGPDAVAALLSEKPSLVHEVSTGGATPLHMCGMSRRNQVSTALLIKSGGDIEAQDSYGYRPLHRMASNNLAIGAQALMEAGVDVHARACGATPLQIAQASAAHDVIRVLRGTA